MISPRVRAKMYRTGNPSHRVLGRPGQSWRSRDVGRDGFARPSAEEDEEDGAPDRSFGGRRVWTATSIVAGLIGLVFGILLLRRRI